MLAPDRLSATAQPLAVRHCCTPSCYVASGIGEAPDSPATLLDWESVQGTFTDTGGRTRTLTNGLGGTLIRQWKPYPNVLVLGNELQT